MNYFLKLLTIVCATSGLLLPTSVSAQWKWKDKNDRIQYSDTPPPSSVPESAILQKPHAGGPSKASFTPTASASASAPMMAASGASAPKLVDPELEAKRKKAEQDQLAKQKAEEEKRVAAKRDNCNRAKSQMRALDDGVRVTHTNEKGEREILDDKARAEETARTREAIVNNCAP
jgi:hypothetical protein